VLDPKTALTELTAEDACGKPLGALAGLALLYVFLDLLPSRLPNVSPFQMCPLQVRYIRANEQCTENVPSTAVIVVHIAIVERRRCHLDDSSKQKRAHEDD